MAKETKSASAIRICAPFLKGCMGLYAFTILSGIIVNLITTVIPRIISYTVDAILGNVSSGGLYSLFSDIFGGAENLVDNLWAAAIAIVALAVVNAFLSFFQNHSNTCATQRMTKNMQTGLFRHIERLPLSYFSNNTTGDIIQRCTTDVNAIANFISKDFLTLFRTITLIILSLVFMFSMNVYLALIAFAFIPAVVIYSVLFHIRAQKHFRKCDEEEGVLSAMAQENYTGVRVVRAFGREKYESDKFEKQNEHYTGLWVRIEKYLALFWSTSDVIAALQLMTVIAVGTVFCINGSLTEGDLISFILYNTILLNPVKQLGRVIANMSRAKISAERIGAVMDVAEEPYSLTALSPLSGDIKIENVSFSYTEGIKVLENINLTIPEGSTLGIIGGTGSGKSTLAYLIDALYPLQSGSIHIGDKNLSVLSPNAVRQNIGFVLQEGYLFSGTIRDNIAACGEMTDEEAMKLAKTASVDKDIKSFSQGLDTMVGERGVTLSGGQKQRISLARTLAREKKYLILDDTLSAVDAETDSEIRGNLAALSRDVTAIIISHRISSVMHADNIIVLEDGKITEQGDHEKLITLNGRYKQIFDAQTILPRDAECAGPDGAGEATS